MKEREILRIYVEEIGWVNAEKGQPIVAFPVNGEMALVYWYRKGKKEYSGKYVITIEYV